MDLAQYSQVTPKMLEHFKSFLSEDLVITIPTDLEPYSHDETEDLHFLPQVVLKPTTTQQVSQIMKICFDNNIPVTPRGGGTGLSGGALPIYGGVVLSTEKMNRILEIDSRNLMAVVEPGVITEILQTEVEKVGLFYPPDPASKGSCFMGGNIAECAGGPRALKYGVTKDYVYGLEVVLPDGKIINTGGKLLKNVSGYNLVQLFIGSEGTLGIVTKITLKLIPLPQFRKTILVPFNSIEAATVCLTQIFANKIIPCAAEFLEKKAVQAAEKKFEKKIPHSECEALLLLAVDGNDESVLEKEIEKIGEVCLNNGAVDVFLAETKEQQEELWKMRRSISEAVKSISIYKEEDTVVPRAAIPDLMRVLKEIEKKYEINIICYGHAGDGNIHANIIKESMSDEKWNRVLPEAIKEIFTEVVKLGGSISGEHGIGYVQKDYLPIALSETELGLMRLIKKVFDPKNILNPGKLLP
ncbi:MAG: dehydrogenase [candidate division Zixibacteria bacterium RBG_16_50_21]|nr:MAG: dehydrogenase [candidate division Zixibacteria bacterium RBG_16_50_21]